MLNADVTVANGTAFSEDNETAILVITVTNTSAVPCKEDTDAYYYISLSDGANDVTYTFVVADPGTIDASHKETFTVENTVFEALPSSTGVIYYTAA
jgi:sugar lactone lactonase YvrE